MTTKDYYQILNLKRDANEYDIRRSYRKLASAYHPDKYPENTKFAEDMMKQINAAFEVLSHPEKKAQYDEWLNSNPGHNANNKPASGSHLNNRELQKYYRIFISLFQSNRNIKIGVLIFIFLLLIGKVNSYINSLPIVVSSIDQYSLGENLDDFRFKHSIKASPTLDTESDVAYLSEDGNFLFRFNKSSQRLDQISHLCTSYSYKFNDQLNGVGCSSTSEDILKKYGNSKVQILCSKDLAEPNKRLYQIDPKGIAYFLDSNSTNQINIFEPKENEPKADSSYWGVCGIDNPQASSMLSRPIESLSESEYRNQYICPENLASDADRKKTVDDMLKWLGAHNKSNSVTSLVNFRMSLLTEHKCKITLQNIAKNSAESDRYTQASADSISKRFDSKMKKSGMSGVIVDLQKCYVDATTNGNDIEELRSCYFYDKLVMGMDKGFREFMAGKGYKDPGPTTNYLTDDAFSKRQETYLPIAFPEFTSEQIRLYYSDAKANLESPQ
ncbi:J domain-containing protein [Polynucleobacter paneuropaeus]|nr:J domain-containing protein [Polynucleobacter paneuropaeus]